MRGVSEIKDNNVHRWTLLLADNHRCDFSLSVGKLFVKMNADFWKEGEPTALYVKEQRFFRWELLTRSKSSKRINNLMFNKFIKKLNRELERHGINDEIKTLEIHKKKGVQQ